MKESNMSDISLVDGTEDEHEKPDFLSSLKLLESGTGDPHKITVAAMQSIGIDYWQMRLRNNLKEYFLLGGNAGDPDAVTAYQNAIPFRLLAVLSLITPEKERHQWIETLISKGDFKEFGEFPREYDKNTRSHVAALDEGGALLEIPDNLVSALRSGADFDGDIGCEWQLQAYYAPLKVRAILHYMAPDKERDEYLLNEEERKGFVDISFDEPLDSKVRLRLVEMVMRDRRISDLDDRQFGAFVNAEFEDVEDLEDEFI
jgi:hypothetical protein